jgi:hypothetical protein
MSLFREAQNAILDIKAQGREQELSAQIKAVADAAELTGLAYKARDEVPQSVPYLIGRGPESSGIRDHLLVR